jgi:UDP-N-acetylglucosamine--dolichyl-phosphate N-acetylglucosaminephosphotransferase
MLAEMTVAALVAALISELMHRAMVPRYMRRGLLSEDIHKTGRPKVPEPLGPAVYLPFLIASIIFYALTGEIAAIAVASSSGLAFLIGLLDDISPLGPETKPLLLILPALVLIAMYQVIPRPYLPIVGRARLYYVYWPIMLALFTVFSNAVNMMDSLNGMMPLSIYASTIPLVPVLISLGRLDALASLLILHSSLLPYCIRNKYPAKVFGGDSNSLFIGSALASISVISNTEAIFGIALIPFLVSGFSIIASVGGFKERRQIGRRPVILKDGMIKANPDPRAPISLIAIITSEKWKREPDIVREAATLSLISGTLASITFFLLTPH